MSSATSTEIQQAIDSMTRSIVLATWQIIKQFWILYWPYITIFLVAIIVGVIYQIIMLKSGRRNKLPPIFNRFVGSLTYLLFFGLIFIISYWIWSTQVINELWLGIFGALAFPFTGIFLRGIGFWYY